MPQQRLTIPLPDARLEAVLHTPGGQGPYPAVLVCHPHPGYGGTMDNNVVLGLCRGLENQGIAALRYNYRGVEGSQGEMVAGDQDVEDAIAVLRFLSLREGVDASQMGICGYSFGAQVALYAGSGDQTPRAVAVVGCPAPVLNDGALHSLAPPKLFLSGDRDHVVSPEDLRFFASRFRDPKELHLLEGADHFLLGYEEQVGDLVSRFFARWIAAPGGSRRERDDLGA